MSIAAKCKKCGTVGCSGNNSICNSNNEFIGITSSTNYDTINEIVKLIKSIPNDMELGRAVRELFS